MDEIILMDSNSTEDDDFGVLRTSSYTNDTAMGDNITFVVDIRKVVYPIMMPAVLTLCLISFILSSFVVCSTPFVKRPMSPTIRLSLSLSAANAAFSGVVFTGTVIHSYLPGVFEVNLPNCINLAVEALRMGVILVQVYHLLAVALIHYLGTLRPLQYAATLTPHFLKVMLLVLWTFPILGIFIGFTSVPNQGFQSKQCSNNHFRENGIYFRYVWSLIYFGPTIILVLVYVHIFVILSRRGRNLEDSEHRKTLYRNMKTVKTTGLIVVSFLIGWSPAVIAFLLICEDCMFQIRDMRVSMAIFSTTYILIILKVFVDTFIYALRLLEIREALRILCSTIFQSCLCSANATRRNRGFHVVSSGTTNSSRSTYLTSIKSSTCNSQKDKTLNKSLSSSDLCRTYVTIEMKPLFNKE